MGITAGVDIGSLTAKAVVVDSVTHEILGDALAPTGHQPPVAGEHVLRQALQEADVSLDNIDRLVATGYGRASIKAADQRFTEISCLAAGIHHLLPEVRTAVDIGGQDSKVITLDEAGCAEGFALNDRCAAGTGRFLEVMAEALGVEIAQLGRLSLRAEQPAQFSSTCTVFAESELVGMLAEGKSRDNIAAGLSGVVAHQVVVLMSQLRYQPPFALVGGVAKNQGVRAALEELLETDVRVPDQPQMVCALGAALMGVRML
ncbi:MAG: 2-hydroxyglutaryl-CoA dehydratase [Armatimonadetes bacterium]|nr:2-hydroxyglutaryl-CoA dehydratase [Armatimonadota bacterium]